MKYYVDSKNITEKLVTAIGTLIESPNQNIWKNKKENELPVCLVYNTHSTDVIIGVSEAVIDALLNKTDLRPKEWYYIETKDLIALIPGLKERLEKNREE